MGGAAVSLTALDVESEQFLDDIEGAAIDLVTATAADFPKEQARRCIASGWQKVLKSLPVRKLHFHTEKFALEISL